MKNIGRCDVFEDLIENEPEEVVALDLCSYALDQSKCPYYEFDGNDSRTSMTHCEHYGCLTSYCYREGFPILREYNENV
jgi:hypothetical protein